MKRLLTLIVMLLPIALSATIISTLKVEYQQTPIGIDEYKPRFSWQMQSENNQRQLAQVAYRILVENENGVKVWDSKKVKTNSSLNIEYAGEKLEPSTRYSWTVYVWDNKSNKISNSSWFETGLMNPDISAWDGAKWIGGNDQDIPFLAHYLPVFRLEYNIQLDDKSSKASFIFGANDARLMDANMNLFQIENAKDESYFKIELDIEPLKNNQEAKIKLYRVGYHPKDTKDKPLKTINIPLELISQTNQYCKHNIQLSNNLGYADIMLNGQKISSLGINPIGQGGDFIAFPVLGDVGFQVPANNKASFSDIKIKNFREPQNTLANINNETISGGNNGFMKLTNPSQNSMPMLRTEYNIDKQVKKAQLYITSRGIYEFYINGKKVGDDYFNPGATQYNKTLMYQTYDVTNLLKNGDNAMGAILAEGWWSGAATFVGENWNFFGDRQSLLVKMSVTYTDGTRDLIVTNPDTWQYYNDGAVVYGSFFQGEVYDATKEDNIKDWSTSSYNSSAWEKAWEIDLTNTVAFNEEDFDDLQIVGQYGQTVKKIKELTAQSVEEVRPGVYVYDMGQNMVGVPSVTIRNSKRGQKINLRFAEVKYPNMQEYGNNVGMVMLENIRAAMAQDIYYAKGAEQETISPKFTFHGYRFIEITGIDKAPPIEDVKGLVLSSINKLSSHYQTSNSKVNKLWENITWSTYGNFLSIPTDCPQRNERLGWSGDISVFAKSATYFADIPQFLRKHLLAMRDVQGEDGRFTDVAPLGGGFGEVLWGSAGITVAWDSYMQYNDINMLKEHYPAMKSYIMYLQNGINPTSGILFEEKLPEWGALGDWLSPEYDKSAKALLWEAYFIHDLSIMADIANILKKDDDKNYFTELRNKRKRFYNDNYIDKNTAKFKFKDKPVDTQASYSLALLFDVVSEDVKDKVINNFAKTVSRRNLADNGAICPEYSLMTGFIGTSLIAEALSEYGNQECAYRLLQQTQYPSWLYPVTQGATTIWERLNSYTHKDGFGGNNRMNSFNHYSFGAIASWMYSHSLGIERDEKSPGFQHFILQPEVDPTDEMTYAKGYYESMYGRIESSWEMKGNECHYNFVVPPNTTATVRIEVDENDEITQDRNFVRYEAGKAILELGSGEYSYIIR